MNPIIENFVNPDILRAAWPDVFAGFLVTVRVALLIGILGILAGLGLAVVRCAEIRVLNITLAVFIGIFRTLPQLVVIIFLYFGLPYAGISLSPFATTVIALAAVLSAFSAEIFWAAIVALPPGQWEAARALGLRQGQILWLIILPQAIRLATPLLTNRTIAITKGTALGTAVALPETLGSAQSMTSMLANPSPLTLAAALYLVLFLPLVVLSRLIERRATPAQV